MFFMLNIEAAMFGEDDLDECMAHCDQNCCPESWAGKEGHRQCVPGCVKACMAKNGKATECAASHVSCCGIIGCCA